MKNAAMLVVHIVPQSPSSIILYFSCLSAAVVAGLWQLVPFVT